MNITPFKLTQKEILLSAATTLLLKELESADTAIKRVSDVCQPPRYGFTASASREPIGPHFVRITDIQRGSVDWNKVPFCPDPSTTNYDLAPGDLLIARSGSVGKSFLVREVPSRAVFASYLIRLRVNADILASFLYWCLQSRQFWVQVAKGRRGSAMSNVNGRVLANLRFPMPSRALQEAIVSFLESFLMRLTGGLVELPSLPPPLTEQRRIVARIEELVAKIEEATRLRRLAASEVDSLTYAASTWILGRAPPHGRLADVLHDKPKNGWSARCDNLPEGIPVLSLAAITGFHYRSTEFKRTSEPVSQAAHYWLKSGDLLMTRSNTPELVGHAAIYDGSPSPCIYPDLMMRLDVDESKADRQFVHRWLSCALVRNYIRERAKGTSPTMKKISQRIVMGIPFPSDLPISEQRQMVSYVNDLQSKIDVLRKSQAETGAELDAILPSILDKAFKGEL